MEFSRNEGSVKLRIGEYDSREGYISRYRTNCCALGQLSLNIDHTIDEIVEVINQIKQESQAPINTMQRDGAERAIFVITIVGAEEVLEDKLAKVGFKMIYEFHSRAYNPEDRMLRMWIISW